MSEENVDTVRRIYDRLNRDDAEAVIGCCEDDFRLDMTERVFNPDTYEGHDGIRRFCEGVQDAWESYRWTIEGTRVAGDVVIAMLHCEGRSRPGVDWRVAWLWEFRGARAISARFYRDRGKALEAAGLRE